MIKMKSLILIGAVVLIGMTGCGKSDSSTVSDANDKRIGVFVDAPVKGLEYFTNTYSGTTNFKGEFIYKDGEMITFKIGNVLTHFSLFNFDVFH